MFVNSLFNINLAMFLSVLKTIGAKFCNKGLKVA